MLVVAVASSTQSAAQRTVTITYGGQTPTNSVGDMSSTTIQHTQIYYFNEAKLDAASGNTLSISFSGGTATLNTVFAAVFDNVNQQDPITNSQVYNSNTTAVDPFEFATALSINNNDQAIAIINTVRIGNTAARTISSYPSSWSNAGGEQTGSYDTTPNSNDQGIRNAVTERSIPTSNTTSTVSFNLSNSARASMTALSLKTVPPTITVFTSPSGCVGSSFTISGTNFTGATAVKIGSTNVTSFTVNSATQITAVIPSVSSGIVSVTTPGGTASSADNIIVTPSSVAGTVGSNQSICSGSAPAALSLTGNTGNIQWQFSQASPTTGFFDLAGETSSSLTLGALTATRYYRAVVTNGACTSANSNAVTITVNAPASATISYSGSPFCKSVTTAQSVTRTGTSGGNYSASPAGLTINASTGAITPSTSTAGNYTVTYTVTPVGCSAFTTTASVTITTLPAATITYSGAPFCDSNSNSQAVTRTGTAEGTFSSTAGLTIDAITGAIAPSTSTAGTYTVTYTMAAGGGCVAQTATTSVTVNPSPTVNAGSDFNLCSGQTVALSASTNATSSSGTANSGTVTASGLDINNPTATYTFTGLPAGAVVSGITVNISSAGGANCPGFYVVTTRINGVQQGVAGCAGSTSYSNFNGQAANGLVIAVRGQDNDAYAPGDAMTITYTVSLNYTFGIPTYAWTPSTGLSATNVLNPTCSTTSTQTYTLTVTGGNGCSASDQVVATVAGGAVPTTPTAAVSGASTVNVGGTVILTSTAGANTVWYTTETGGSSVGTGSPFTTPVQCTAGTITYYAEEDNGNCTSNARAAVSFTVRPVLVSNPANALICQDGGSVTLSAQLTGASNITWSPNTNLSSTTGSSTVASPAATTLYTMSATVAGCGAVSSTQTVGVIDAVAFTPTSTPAVLCAGNPAVLASNLSSSGFTSSTTTYSYSTAPGNATLLINNGAAVPANPYTSTNTAYPLFDDAGWGNIPIPFTYNFFGENYNALNIGTNGIVHFGNYSSAIIDDFTFTSLPNAAEPLNIIAVAANDNDLTGSGNGTLRYWTEGIAPTRRFIVEWSAASQQGSSGARKTTAQVKLFETTGSVEVHVSSSTSTNTKVVGLQNNDSPPIGAQAFSNTATMSNQAWKFVPGANYTFQWATAGSNIEGASSSTYTTPALNIPGTVTYNVSATNPNTQCTTTQPVSVTVNALPAAPNSTGDVTACSTSGNQTLAVTAGAGETADWYAASSGGAVLASGNNVLAFSTATTGTYYAAAQNTTTGCSSASRTGVTLTVNTSPAAPTVSTPVTYCQGSTATALTATAAEANTLNWYSAAPNYPSITGATALGSAPTPATLNAGTTNYYVSQSSNSNGCESELALIAVTVNATPSAPVATNPEPYCQGASASVLSATSTAGNTLYWYTVPTGGTGSSTAPTPSTATAGTIDYYVADRNNSSSCEGSRTTVTVTVNPTITASVTNSASSTSACGGGAITFTATPTNGGSPTYQWYLNNNPVGTNSATYTLSTPNNADAIYVEMTPSAQTCLSSNAATNSNTVTLTSTAATPTVSIQSSASTAFCPGTSVVFSVNSSANMGATPAYQWNLNGTPISGETNATLTTSTLVNNDQVTLTMTSSLSGGCLTQSSATSSSISSTVNNATAITGQPAAASACLGGSQSFAVTATGTGTLTYQWKKNGLEISGNATATSSTLTLSGIAAEDVANYTVDVTGTCGTVTSNAAALTINSATVISTQPSAAVDCAGATVNFSVVASGQGTLSYQWRKDGGALAGETNSTLVISNISIADAGQYSVVVSGDCGVVTSSNALLTINAATVISTQPADLTLCADNTANFSVTASGAGTLSYQWKKEGSNVGTNSSTLSIPNAQSANAGIYTVDVTGACGTVTSSTALLTVNPLTAITTQPVSTAGCQGQSSSFTVVAAGTSPLTYQWKFGGVNISGATAASYTIPTATIENDGAYFVTVTGGCGAAVNSNTVVLEVTASTTYYADADGDGYGNNNSTQSSCSQPVGYVANNTDCNDNSNSANPGASEICNNSDDNCNNQIDEGASNSASTSVTACGSYTWSANSITYTISGNYTFVAGCNTQVLQLTINTLVQYYLDADQDGFGNLSVSTSACTMPNGYVLDAGDCDDNNAAANPEATELCENTFDDNCDGNISEEFPGASLVTYYLDQDSDGSYSANSVQMCAAPSGLYTTQAPLVADCNDNNFSIKPGGVEICGNEVDEDCNAGDLLPGYYKSTQSGAWNNDATWSYSCDNSTYSSANYFPPVGYVGNVVITSGTEVTIPANNIVYSAGTMVIEASGSLILTGNAALTSPSTTYNGNEINTNVPNLAKFTLYYSVVNNGTLTVGHMASFLQSSEATGNGNSGEGTFVVNMNLTGTTNPSSGNPNGRYWYIGSPMNNTQASLFYDVQNKVRLWSYIPENNSWFTLINSSTTASGATNSTLLVPGIGYLYRSGSPETVTFSGNASQFNNNITTPLSFSGTGYKYVANPYTSYVDWRAVTRTGLNVSYWVRNAANTNYESFNATS
jgi:hypothetical protein